jgi:hypothetical protein
VRVLVDYRPALKERTGVGEYVHQFVRALLQAYSKPDLHLSLISSSWKDRFTPSSEIAGHIEQIGYVEAPNRRAVYEGARLRCASA